MLCTVWSSTSPPSPGATGPQPVGHPGAPAWLARVQHHQRSPVVLAFAISLLAHWAVVSLPLGSQGTRHYAGLQTRLLTSYAGPGWPASAGQPGHVSVSLQLNLRDAPSLSSADDPLPVTQQPQAGSVAPVTATAATIALTSTVHGQGQHRNELRREGPDLNGPHLDRQIATVGGRIERLVDAYAGDISPIPDEDEIRLWSVPPQPDALTAEAPTAVVPAAGALVLPLPANEPKSALVAPRKLFGMFPVTSGAQARSPRLSSAAIHSPAPVTAAAMARPPCRVDDGPESPLPPEDCFR